MYFCQFLLSSLYICIINREYKKRGFCGECQTILWFSLCSINNFFHKITKKKSESKWIPMKVERFVVWNCLSVVVVIVIIFLYISRGKRSFSQPIRAWPKNIIRVFFGRKRPKLLLCVGRPASLSRRRTMPDVTFPSHFSYSFPLKIHTMLSYHIANRTTLTFEL